MAAAAPEPFDRRRRRARRDRAAARIDRHRFVADHIGDELLARLDAVREASTRFRHALLIGASPPLAAALAARGVATVTAEPGFRLARAARGVQCDEDRLPFADGAFDLVLSVSVLDAVNDLPGALILARRALRPDGLLLAGFAGAGSLPRLRAAMLGGDMAAGAAAARIHPQVDVRAAGDLLQRAGFALPVADGDGIDVRYASLAGLLADLRFSGGGGVLARAAPIGRRAARVAAGRFAAAADADGRTAERIEIVFLTGWAPDPSQAAPRRASAPRPIPAPYGQGR